MAIDPRFQEQARTFITETMKAVIPTANVDGGSGINAVFGRGAATISASLLQEIEHLLTSRDLTDPEALTEADMDLLMENLLTDRDGGDLAFGFVRLFYPDRIQREFATGLIATIESKEVNFVTLADLIFAPQDYFVDAQTGLFYINVPFTAEAAGDVYNVDVGEINQLLNDNSGASRVTNVEAFRNGKPAQTNTQALRKAQRSVSTRTPLSRDGAIFWYQELFGGKLQDMLVVGAGDDEMIRDEVTDLGVGQVPQFQIGVDGIDPVTREQLGTLQNLFVGGRTDIYSLYDTVNYVQETVDLFADMLLDTDISTPISTIDATFVPGTTGEVAATGKLIIDLGEAGEEIVAYSSRSTVDGNTYTFTLIGLTTQIHAPGATVKVVNNSEITIAPDGDITVLPVFQVAEVRLLDPVTFEPVGEALPETRPDSSIPGWYIARSNRYDIMSAKETKTLVIDEKRDSTLWPGNQAINGVGGTLDPLTIGGGSHTKYTAPGQDFTGYQGREITLSGGVPEVTRSILQVISPTEVAISGEPLVVGSTPGVAFVIDAAWGEFNEFPVRLSFYTNTELQEAQQFLDQDSRRILGGDALSRAFLPVFIDFTMQYRGNGEPLDIRDRVNDVLQTSSGEAIGESEGAKFDYSDLINAAYTDGLANYVVTPFEVRVRRLQLDGTFKVDYVNPGPNTVNELAVKVDPGVMNFPGDGSYSDGGSILTSTAAPFTPADIGKKVWISGVGLATILSQGGSTATLDITFSGDASNVDWSFPALFLETKLPSQINEFTVPAEGKLYLGAFTGNNEVVEYSSVVISGTDYTFIIKDGESINLPHAVNEPLRVASVDYDDANVIKDGIITDERTYRPFLGEVVIEKLGS